MANLREHRPVRARDVFKRSNRDWTYIEPMGSHDDFVRARLDVRAKWEDAIELAKSLPSSTSSDLDRINTAFGLAKYAIDTAQSTFENANKAIKAASNCAVAYKAKAPPPPSPAPPVLRIDMESELKLKSEEARNALKFYKETNGEEFEFVEILRFENQLRLPYVKG